MDQPTDTLLDRLRRDGTPRDWELFFNLYGPLLAHWAQRLSPPDGVADLVQDVLVQVMQKLPSFAGEGDRSFLGWLRVVLLNRWRDLCRRAAARPAIDNRATLEAVAANQLDDVVAAEDRMFLIRRAMQIMQSDFESTTWRACWEHVAVDRPAADVAAELGVSVDVVYAASYRVIKRLRAELAGGWK
jgi:RNA polymerase sigma-70 factor (ECF subfamily)